MSRPLIFSALLMFVLAFLVLWGEFGAKTAALVTVCFPLVCAGLAAAVWGLWWLAGLLA